MLHIVQAGWLLDDPAGGAQGAVSEIVTAMSAMDELDAFPQAGKHHRVLTYNIAPPKRLHPDFSVRTLSDETVSGKNPCLVQVTIQNLCDNLSQLESGAAWCVLLESMVSLEDFNVEAGAQHTGYFGHHFEEYIDPHAHIGSEDAGDHPGEGLGFLNLAGAESG